MAKKVSRPEPSREEMRNAIFAVVQSANAPLTSVQISKALVAPNKLAEKKLTPYLDQFVARGELQSIAPATAKGKSRYWDRDVSTVARVAINELMSPSQQPLTAKEIARQLQSSIKFAEQELIPILEERVQLKELHLIPPRTASGKPRYWNRDLGEFVRATLLPVLNCKGPQALPDLKKAVKGLSESQFQIHFENLIASGAVVRHPPIGKKGKTLFGSRPPMPEPYFKELGASLAGIVSELRSAKVSMEDLRRTLVQMIETAGVSFRFEPAGTTRTSSAAATTTVDLISLIRRLEPAADRGILIAPRKIREAAGLNKTAFDHAVMDLAASGKISLHRHDYVASLTDAERNDLVSDGAGAYYVGLALRQTAGGSLVEG